MAQERLEINEGETYTVPEGDRHEYYGATANGQLDLSEGSMSLIDDPEADTYGETTETPSGGIQPGSSPISLPLEIDLQNMNIGNAVFLTLTLGLLAGLTAFLRNYAAGIVLCLSVLILIVSGLLNIGLELFWASVVATVVLLIAGMALRWIQ